MPNNFAYIALILWPFISVLFFYRHMPIVQATFWTIVGGFMILPVKTIIDFPLIPPLDKESIPIIAAIIGCKYIKKVNIKLIPKERAEKWLVIALLFIPFVTMLNNQETFNGIPGLTLYDTVSAIISQYLFILPFILGMQIIKTYEDQLLLFKLLVIAGLIYSIPILFEVRMSPQLHTWTYGYFPHSFLQQIRFDGFRPVVFMGHGLVVSMFLAITIAAAAILLKQKVNTRGFSKSIIIIYFLILLLLCKTVGAFLLGFLLLLAILFGSLKVIKWASLIIVATVVLYPLLSIFNVFPHDFLLQLATGFDVARGESLGARFYHEGNLLAHAKDKLFFGWGGWGRSRLEGAVTDGYWIIVFGQYGILGFIAFFGLPALSVLIAVRNYDKLNFKSGKELLLAHALIVAVMMVDQLPNSSMSSWLLFLMGALLGISRKVPFNKDRTNITPNVYSKLLKE